MLLGLLVAAQPWWVRWLADRAATSLLATSRASLPAPACQATGAHDATHPLVVRAPAIGLVAPVLPGTGGTVLTRAVGHLDGSAWPGRPGAVVLEAHDMTFFDTLGRLHAGDPVVLESSCHAWTYTVTGQRIVRTGAALHVSGTSLVLVTCWPTASLLPTTRRLVVTAVLSRVTATRSQAWQATTVPPYRAPVVPGMPSRDADALGRYGVSYHGFATRGLLGTWVASPAPYLAAEAANATLGEALAAIVQERSDWWSVVAPHLPRSRVAGLWGAGAPG
ncbi:MAG: class D sortase, partial [Actinomycetes bacterium]